MLGVKHDYLNYRYQSIYLPIGKFEAIYFFSFTSVTNYFQDISARLAIKFGRSENVFASFV
jgi:hypothetical protein